MHGVAVLGVRTFSLSPLLAPDQANLRPGRRVGRAGASLAAVRRYVALLVKLTSHGPVFFRQERIGRGGRSFELRKFRSMVADAEERKAGLVEHNQAADGFFKIADDPRITRVGRFLRRTNLDEFPQLLNVLRGEMSLVGTEAADPSGGQARRRLAPAPARADPRHHRALAGTRLEPGADRRDDRDRLPVRSQLVAVDRSQAAPADDSACDRGTWTLTSRPLEAAASGRSVDAQVFQPSARHPEGDLNRTGYGEVLIALIVILAVWLVGVPLAAVGLTALLMWRDRESARLPRSRYRIRLSAFGRRCAGRRCDGRPAHGSPAAGRVRARSRHSPCRVLMSGRRLSDNAPYPCPNPRARDARSRCSITLSTRP